MKYYLIVVFIIILTGCSVQNHYLSIDELHISKDNFLDDFNEINAIVKDRYSHMENKKIDIDILSNKYIKRIAEINTKEEYILTLEEYFHNLRNSHSGLYLKPFAIKVSAKRFENQVFVNVVKDKVFLEAGIKKYDEIISVNNIPVLLWLKNEEKYISASTLQDLRERTLIRLFRSKVKQNRIFKIKTSKEVKTIDVELSNPWTSSSNGKTPFVRGEVVSDSVGYIEILSMTGEVISQFERIYDTLSHLPSLIIDVRKNGGGNSRNSEKIAKYLLKSPKKASVSGSRLRPAKNAYKGNLCILTGPYTFSAAESFVIDLVKNENTMFIGMETGGDTGNRTKIFTTSNGIYFKIPTRKPPQISPYGFPMEGIGVKPNFEIQLTTKDYFKNVDTTLEFAIDYLDKSH